MLSVTPPMPWRTPPVVAGPMGVDQLVFLSEVAAAVREQTRSKRAKARALASMPRPGCNETSEAVR